MSCKECESFYKCAVLIGVTEDTEQCQMEINDIDDYICPECGRPSETCFCEDDYLDYEDSYWDDGCPPYWYEEDDDEWEKEEIICYVNGNPMTKSDLERLF
jgi:predicted amidophosphoribosyltransferase